MDDNEDSSNMNPIDMFKYLSEQQKASDDKMSQADDSVKMEFAMLIGDLDVEQLKTLHNMLINAANDPAIGFQLSGVVSGALVYKHGMSWNGKQTPWSKSGINESGDRELSGNDALELLTTTQLDANMRMYNVEPHDTAEGYFQCSNCKSFIQSLEDRMLRPPGAKGCEGCANKAKWGG